MNARKKNSSNAKSKQKLARYADFDQLSFPSNITASFVYSATGEGVTRGVYMLYADSAKDLRESLIKLWGEYYAIGSEAANGLIVMPSFEDLIPASVHSFLEERYRFGKASPIFSFNALLHKNYA